MAATGMPGVQEAGLSQLAAQGYSTKTAINTHHSTETQRMQEARGQAVAVPSGMLFQEPVLDPVFLPTALPLGEAQKACYLLRTDIQGMRCPTGNFGAPPTAQATRVPRATKGILAQRHPQAEVMLTVESMVQRWHAIMGPEV